MERRHFLKLALGFAAGAVVLAAGAEAAPLTPQPITRNPPPGSADTRPAVATGDEADRLAPEQVRWGRGRRGWGRRRWRRRRHWGWRRHWRRRRRYWRRRFW